jgi:excisionase family DNA binding protein
MSEERLTYTVQQAGHLLGLSRNSMYRAIEAGELPSLRIGKRLLVPRDALEAKLRSAGTP